MRSKFPPKKVENPVVRLPEKRNWSTYQVEIFKNFKYDNDNLIIEALAGCAKTSTAIEGLRYIPKGKKTLMLAFNNSIATELRERAPSYVDTFTFHSLGLRAIKQAYGNTIQVDQLKLLFVVKSVIENCPEADKEIAAELTNHLTKLVSLCKATLSDMPSNIEDIVLQFDIDTCGLDMSVFVGLAMKTLSLCKKDKSKIDFDDMCWFPFVYNLSVGQYDVVICDESQDLNKAQLVMAQKALKPNGKLVMIGDPFQSLYSWRGADNTVIQSLKDKGTKILNLPITYRCPKLITEFVKPYVSSIQPSPTAKDGKIENIKLDHLYDKATPGCFILSRVNAPLIKIALNFIKLGKKANIQGRDIGAGLSYLIKKSKKETIKGFLKWLDKYKKEELEKLIAKKINPETLIDKCDCLISICEESKTLDEVNKNIKKLFNDVNEDNIIILSSVHRAKGRERDSVFVLEWTLRSNFYKSSDNDVIDDISRNTEYSEENNIAYVAFTRSKNKLFLVSK